MSSSMRDVLLGWKGTFVGKRRNKVWQATPCLFWTVWMARNRIVFKENVVYTETKIFVSFFALIED